MSNHGPPGGPYPGPGPEPWPGRQEGQGPADPYVPGPRQRGGYGPGPQQGGGYGPDSAPWGGGGQGQWGGSPDPAGPGYGSSQRYEAGFTGASTPRWTAPAPPPPKKSRVPFLALLATLVVLVCGGGSVVYYLVGRDGGGTSAAAPTTGATTAAGTGTQASTDPEPTTPEPESSTNARFVKPGQCLKNEGGTPEKPSLVITTCGPKTYQVLQRFDGATNGKEDAVAKCSKVEGYTDWYFFNSELDVLDYVLCLKLR